MAETGQISVSSRPVWTTWDTVSKTKRANKHCSKTVCASRAVQAEAECESSGWGGSWSHWRTLCPSLLPRLQCPSSGSQVRAPRVPEAAPGGPDTHSLSSRNSSYFLNPAAPGPQLCPFFLLSSKQAHFSGQRDGGRKKKIPQGW